MRLFFASGLVILNTCLDTIYIREGCGGVLTNRILASFYTGLINDTAEKKTKQNKEWIVFRWIG